MKCTFLWYAQRVKSTVNTFQPGCPVCSCPPYIASYVPVIHWKIIHINYSSFELKIGGIADTGSKVINIYTHIFIAIIAWLLACETC